MDSIEELLDCVMRTQQQLSELKNLLGDHSDLDPPDFHAELRSETN